jgi:hypothetical protein
MPTAAGAWVPVLDGSGWERYTTEDGTMRRQFKGVDDDLIAKQAEQMRNEISSGRGEGGNMAFHMPAWLLTEIEKRSGLNDMSMDQKKRWWKGFESTSTGRKYKVRGV